MHHILATTHNGSTSLMWGVIVLGVLFWAPLAMLLLRGLFGLFGRESPSPTAKVPTGTLGMPDDYYRVAKVIDATTLDVWDSKGLVRVWMHGLVGPEEETPRHHRARKLVRQKLQRGDLVHLKVHEFDFKWRRAIAEITTEEGESLGDLLSKTGLCERLEKTGI